MASQSQNSMRLSSDRGKGFFRILSPSPRTNRFGISHFLSRHLRYAITASQIQNLCSPSASHVQVIARKLLTNLDLLPRHRGVFRNGGEHVGAVVDGGLSQGLATRYGYSGARQHTTCFNGTLSSYIWTTSFGNRCP